MNNLPAWARNIHHDSSEMYLSDIAPRVGDVVRVRIRAPRQADLRALILRARPDGEWKRIPMARESNDAYCDFWAADLPITMRHNNYCFKFLTANGSFYFNQFGLSPVDSPDWFHFTVLGDYDAPSWVREQVFYQIFPERFANGDPSNDIESGQPTPLGKPTRKRAWGERPGDYRSARTVDYFGGDLQGVARNLDYLAELGVTAIYLNPIFDAESNHFYLIKDFDRVAPGLGGDEALLELRRALDARGMKLILDITPNHIGFTHPWYLEAKDDPSAESAEFFHRHPDTGELERWLGVPHLLKLNHNSQKLRDRLYRDADSPIRKWLRPPWRIDGWRLDVANMTGNYRTTQRDHEVWREMRAAIKSENPDAYMMGEYFQDSSPHLQGDELDASMNYQGFNTPVRRWLGGADHGVDGGRPFGDPHPLPTAALALQWRQYLTAIPYVIALQQFNQIGSHDISRPLHVTQGDRALVKAGTALLMAFPGIPCVYYGDEIGLDGGADPDNRRCMTWDEALWDKDLLDFHKRVIAIRRNSHALRQGGFQLLHAAGDFVAFQRQSRREQIIAAVWRGADDMPLVDLDMVRANVADGSRLRDLLSGGEHVAEAGKLRLQGLARGAALFLRVESAHSQQRGKGENKKVL